MNDLQERAEEYYRDLRERILARLETLAGGARFDRRSWERAGGGGGEMAVLRGQVLEKAGCNFSSVHGAEYPGAEPEVAGKPFVASGVSLVIHPYNPHVPVVHLNVRHIRAGERAWFGGGADLTPCFPYDEDTAEWHAALREACGPRYPDWKAECDRYFYIAHRKSPRGVGGVFFDGLAASEEHFAAQQALGEAFLRAWPAIAERRLKTRYSGVDREKQLSWRGRYVEFNLIYDRGTLFGLKSGGDPDAVFMSLPPLVKW
jgi:coproporphyrinogen III oxidase